MRRMRFILSYFDRGVLSRRKMGWVGSTDVYNVIGVRSILLILFMLLRNHFSTKTLRHNITNHAGGPTIVTPR
jgi:hypothetical protein